MMPAPEKFIRPFTWMWKHRKRLPVGKVFCCPDADRTKTIRILSSTRDHGIHLHTTRLEDGCRIFWRSA